MRKIASNLHTHTVYSDGISTAEEYVQAALQKNFESLGFSEHAYAPYDSACCIRQEEVPRYMEEITRLKEKYAGQIDLYLGFENDYFHPASREGVDFLIGSVHYVRDERTGEYYTIDYQTSIFEEAVEKTAGGSVRALVERYYAQVGEMALSQQPDIIGHMDLIVRLNGDNRYFDPDSDWYQDILDQCIKTIAASGCIVEVNTGGMSRGYIDRPYPGGDTLKKLFAAGVPVTISADAHSAETLDHGFDHASQLILDAGYTCVRQLVHGRFVDVSIL